MSDIDENNENIFEKGEVNENGIYSYNKVGRLISEKHLPEFINEEIFFIGEIISIEDNIIKLRSVNGNCVDCIIKNRNFRPDSKYIGIKGIVSNDLKIIETRGIIFINDINFEIVNEYINIYMENVNSEVFLSSY